MTSIFSAGNTYYYCAMRNLYGMALEGRAPKIFTYTTKRGVPLNCYFVVMIFPCLSFLSCGSGTAVVVTWFANLVTGGGNRTLTRPLSLG